VKALSILLEESFQLCYFYSACSRSNRPSYSCWRRETDHIY